MTSNHIKKGVHLNEIENIWTPQLDEWDCWVASLSVALKFWGLPSEHEYILSLLLDTNLKISDTYGGYFSYLAIISHKMGLRSHLKCPLEKNLHELFLFLGETTKQKPYIKASQLNKKDLQMLSIEARKEMYPRGYLYESLAIIANSSSAKDCILYCENKRPSFKDITSYIEKGCPVVAYVRSDEYYHLVGDDSGHLVTFIPVTDSPKGYVILDSYRDRGFQYDINWENALSVSEKYDWNTWSDWMLSISPNESAKTI